MVASTQSPAAFLFCPDMLTLRFFDYGDGDLFFAVNFDIDQTNESIISWSLTIGVAEILHTIILEQSSSFNSVSQVSVKALTNGLAIIFGKK
jgi:hypothetical protein